MKYLRITAILWLLTTVFACSKDDPAPKDESTPPPPSPVETVELREQLIGKWTLDAGFSLSPVAVQQRAAIKGDAARAIVKKMDVTLQAVEGGTAFIEFLDDDTYLLVDANGITFSGLFEIDGNDAVVLSDLGNISELVIEGGKISFKFTNAETSETVTATGSRVEVLDLDDRTNKLVHTWELLPEADGKSFFEEPLEIWGENDTVATDTVMVTRATVTFSASGTYIVRMYADGEKLVMAEASNWQWHSTDANKFVYWTPGWELDEEEDSIEITKLDDSSLHTLESWEEEEGNMVTSVLHFKR